MEPQTESSTVTETTPMVDTDVSCYEKAKANGEPTFTLRAQDITADLVVDFWTLVQVRIESALAQGRTIAEAVKEARNHFGLPEYQPIWSSPKLNGAAEIAKRMRGWLTRKLAA